MFFPPLAKLPQKRYIIKRGNEMAVKVKPVQPTEIKDIKIIREVIAEIRKPISVKIIRRNEKMAAYVKELKK
jgi:hypothetical protein